MTLTASNNLARLIADGKVRPGDVIAFRGKAWISRMIQAFTGQYETHVGVVIRMADGFLYLAESGPAVIRDVVEGDRPYGVGIYPLAQRVCEDDGQAVLLRLANPLNEKQSIALTAAAVAADLGDARYNVWELFQMAAWYTVGQFLGFDPPKPFGKGVVCSVFVTQMLDAVDAVNKNPYGQSPGDVYRWNIWSERIEL